MILDALVASLGEMSVTGSLDRAIATVADDSREVVPGALFIALPGARADGRAYIADAVARGAIAVVCEAGTAPAPPEFAGAVTTIVVPNARRAAARLAARFYGNPSRELTVVGVTGTNGKTTTTFLIAALLAGGGIACARIGTLGVAFGGRTTPLANTTPLAVELQRTLALLRDAGAGAVAMEVSSHALALDRVDDVRFAVGVLTNVTRDHLDFHATFADYAAAKRRLFAVAECAAINLDDELGRRWAAELRAAGRPCTTYSLEARAADLVASDISSNADGSRFVVDGRPLRLALPGRFNVANALAALTVARICGVDAGVAASALADVDDVPGRMQAIRERDVTAIVDYAHTPDALARVLTAARELTDARLIVVFGCGGDRDRGKRPEMGRIAEALADRVVVTSDNPRRESPSDIVDEIFAGISDRGKIERVLDRRDAIRRALGGARAGDVVVIAGKGHETYQIVGDETLPFNDVEEVRAAFAAGFARNPRDAT